MINVFKKRTRLYALTTSAFFFLQGVDASVGNSWFPFSNPTLSSFASFLPVSISQGITAVSEGITTVSEGIASVPSGVLSAFVGGSTGKSQLEAVKTNPRAYVSINQAPGSQVPLFMLFPKIKANACADNYVGLSNNEATINFDHDPIICVDGKEHTIKGSKKGVKIHVEKNGGNAVFAAGRLALNNTGRLRSSAVGRAGVDRNVNTTQGTSLRVRGPSSITGGENGSSGTVDATQGVTQRTGVGARRSQSRPVEGRRFSRTFSRTLDIAKMTSVKIENLSLVGVDPKDFSSRFPVMGVGSAVFSLAGAKVDLLKTDIEKFVTGLEAGYKGNIHMREGSINKTFVGAAADFESSIFLDRTDINVEVVNERVPLNVVGLRSSGGSQIAMKSGSITFATGGVGIWAEDEGFVKLEDIKINIAEKEQNKGNKEGSPEGISLVEGADSSVLDPSLSPSVVFLLEDGFVSSNRVTFNGFNAIALWINNNYSIKNGLFGVIDYDAFNIMSSGSGADSFTQFVDDIIADNYVNISAAMNYSNITVEGRSSYGIYFGEGKLEFGDSSLETNEDRRERDEIIVRSSPAVAELPVGGVESVVESAVDGVESQAVSLEEDGKHMVLLRRSVLKVPDGVAIYGEDLNGSVVLGKDTLVSGDLLLNAKGSSSLSVYTHESVVVGSTRIDENANANLFLSDSEWHLTKSKYDNGGSNTRCIDSCVSSIDLTDSTIAFLRSEGENRGYQTLRVGNGNGTVYTASGDSYIYFNAHLVPSASDSDQISDRLLIHGNVSGRTTVVVNDISDGTHQDQRQSHSVSLIQVYGTAEENSFNLKGGYITREGLPYKYVLRAYGPTNSTTMQYFDSTLVNGKDVWDFRLENQYVGSSETSGTRSETLISQPTSSAELNVLTTEEKTVDGSVHTALPTGGIMPATPESSTGTLSSVESVVDPSNSNLKSMLLSILGLEGATPQKVKLHTFSDPSIGRTYTAGAGWSGVLISKKHLKERLKNLGLLKESDNLEEKLKEFGIVVGNDGSLSVIDSSAVSDRISSSSTPTSSEESASVVATPPISGEESQRFGAAGSSSVSSNSHISPTDVNSDSSRVTIVPVSKRPAPIKSAATMKLSTPAPSIGASAPVASGKPAAPSNGASALKLPASVGAEKPAAPSGAVGRILLSNSDGKETVSTCDAAQNNGGKALQTRYSCSDGQSRTITNLTLKASDNAQSPMHVKNQDTVIKLEGATISGADSSDSKSKVDFTTLQAVSAVLSENKAEVILNNKSTITSSVIGLEAQSGGKVTMNDGTVNALYVGALAGSGSSVNLKDTTINVAGDLAAAGLASNAGEIIMSSGTITQAKGVAVRSESGGRIELDKVNITMKKATGKSDSADDFGGAAFLLSDNASVDFKNGTVVTDANALWVIEGDGVVETGTSRKKRSSEVRSAMNHANIEASTVKVEGEGTYGIYFDGLTQKEESQQNRSKNLETGKANVVKRSPLIIQDKPIAMTGTVSLKKTDFQVAKGVAIYGNNSGGRVLLENKTTLSGDLLLKAENDSNISVLVDNSIVAGGVRVNEDSYAKLDLANSSEWILKRSVQKSSGTPDLGCLDSCLSSVRLVNSAINFAPSESGRKYQTLHIGNGKGIVYEAQGDAVIHLNARLNPHDSSGQQVTDQLVIHGDVSGKTKIHVRGDAGNVANSQVNAKIAHSVSVIQVYGQAEKDSFQLDGDYVALANSPYKYTLRAYGPEATLKQEHARQKFVKDGGAFWNFRLENQYVKSAGSSALPEKFVRSVVPQVPTYLVLPNSVFHAGLMDINNQSKQLETLRMTSTGMVEVRENPALYLRGYGGSYRYASDLSALEYGYDGDFDYRGVEAGVLLQTIENTDSALSFGIMGTYGNLSLQPLNVEQSQKSAFDKWTATVYGSMQHNMGFYVDGLLSYGLFKGDVLTLARGKTATLKGNPLSVSLIGGQTIATGYKGFVFDPQVQVVYQHLQFNKARDIDSFDIQMGNLDQWVARVGGRLTKNPTGSEGVSAVAFYGKLYLAHGFGEKQTVHFSDAFKLGAFGSSLETGVGFNVKLLPQFSLHADILYQHKLNKAGFSGASFSGGVRYQF